MKRLTTLVAATLAGAGAIVADVAFTDLAPARAEAQTRAAVQADGRSEGEVR
jgi:hypothetical protein